MNVGWMRCGSTNSPNTSSNGQRVYAQIRNPVIVTERTMYGHDLKILKSADIVFPDGTTPQYVGNSEGFYRDGAQATSSFIDLDAKYRVTPDLTVKGLFSTTRGVAKAASPIPIVTAAASPQINITKISNCQIA